MRSLWLVNVLLGVALTILLEGIVSLALDRPSSIFAVTTEAPHVRRAVPASGAEPTPVPAPLAVPPLSDFAVVVEKDLFRNPNPEPPMSVAGRPAAAPLPQAPLPVLVGTLFVGDDRKAVLKDQNRTESYGVGERVGGGTLVEIETDRVVIQRDGTSVEVLLRASMEGSTGSRSAGRAPGRVQTSPPPAPVEPLSTAAPGPSWAPAAPAPAEAQEAGVAPSQKTLPAALTRGPLSRVERMERVRQGLERRNQLRREQAGTETP
jgi:hypothetical protein